MYLNNIFGEIPEKNITFVIDSSGSMYDTLPKIKDHIVEVLIERAYSRPESYFNIIDFNSEVTEWSDQMVKCSPATINAAKRWLKGIETRAGSCLKTSIKMAFDESKCEAVYLVTDGCIDQEPRKVIKSILKKSLGRPVHCISVTENSDEISTTSKRFLEDLSAATRGSFHIISINKMGDVIQVKDIYNSTYERVEERFSSTLNLADNPYKYIFPTISPYFRYYPFVDTEALKEELLASPVASVVARGTRVLARHEADGFYYPAHIAQEVQGDRGKFLVEFEKMKTRNFRMQETFYHDVIAFNDALRHSIFPQDKVLAPWEDKGKRFGPGKVIRGIEKRNKIGGHRDDDLLVTFWNGVTRTVVKGNALWVPHKLYDRIVLELQMPISARKELSQNRCNLSMNEDLFDTNFWNPFYSLRNQLIYYPWWNNGMFYLPTYPLLTSFPRLLRSWPTLIFNRPDLFYGSLASDESRIGHIRRYPESKIEGSDLTTSELKDLVESQLRDHKNLQKNKKKDSSSSSSSSDDDLSSDFPKNQKNFSSGDFPHKSISAKSSKLRRHFRKRPKWSKNWPQSPQPRQHLQPCFKPTSPGYFSTWNKIEDQKLSIYDKINYQKIKSDRQDLIQHLKTPYVERSELAKYSPVIGRKDFDLNRHKDRILELERRSREVRASAWAQREDDRYKRSMYIENARRNKNLQRFEDEMKKQKKFDEKISKTLEAKSKINQDFRNAFYLKELENYHRQQAKFDWLQNRRKEQDQKMIEKVLQNDRLNQSRELGRQYRQSKHNQMIMQRSLSADYLR